MEGYPVPGPTAGPHKSKVSGAPIQPTKKRVLIERLAAEQPVSSTIVIPDSVVTRSNRFRVLAVGPEVLDVGVGDTVLMGAFSGTEVSVGGRTLMIVHIAEVLAVVK